MQLHNDSGAVFTLHSNLGDLLDEMENKRKSVATLVDNIAETTFTDEQSKMFMEHFENDMNILSKLYSEMEEKQKDIKALGDALKKYEKDVVF